MKKNKIDGKGFAMAELLAVSVVILLLFSILFSNYLPLTAEFENRVSYTNVTANYGAFYVRKIYKKAIESNKLVGNQTIQEFLKNSITSEKPFYALYKGEENPNLLVTGDLLNRLNSVIDEYGIEEIIITKYKLDDIKGTKGYKRSDGALYNFIKYLPQYKRSKIGSVGVEETYRIILKTTDYGYATTQILTDPPTPVSCFDLEYKNGSFIVKNYNSDLEECGENVTVPSTIITKGSNTGLITAIGPNAFKVPDNSTTNKKKIYSIYLPKNVISIGANAFTNNNISSFNLDVNAPGVTTINNYAFSNNKIQKVVVSDKVVYGEGVFANNYKLSKIEFESEGSATIKIPENMFAMDNIIETRRRIKDSLYKSIELFIPYNVGEIGTSAFKNIKFSSIIFENQTTAEPDAEGVIKPSRLTKIGNNAFAIEDNTMKDANGNYLGDDNYLSIIIPGNVETIGNYAFQNVQIGSLAFETNGSKLDKIGEGAFSVIKVNITNDIEQKFCVKDNETGACNYYRNLMLPATTTEIGGKAFKNQMFNAVYFNEYKEDGSISKYSSINTIGQEAFSGNNFGAVVIPKSLSNSGSSVGKKIFGEEFTLGDNVDGIILQNNDLFTKINWCDALFGNSCTEEVLTDDAGDSGDSGDPGDSETRSYKYNGITKYVTYFGEEG